MVRTKNMQVNNHLELMFETPVNVVGHQLEGILKSDCHPLEVCFDWHEEKSTTASAIMSRFSLRG